MNYPFMNAIIAYVRDGDEKFFKDTVQSILENYPKETVYCLMNSLGTHDTVRIINALSDVRAHGWSKTHKLGYKLPDSEYEKAKKKLYLASVLQFTLPGIPSIFYGDEAGLQAFGYRLAEFVLGQTQHPAAHGNGEQDDVERLGVAYFFQQWRLVNHHGLTLACLQRLDDGRRFVEGLRKRCRHRLHHAGRGYQHAILLQQGQHAGSLAGFEGDQDVGLPVGDQRRSHPLSPVTHAHMAHDAASALGHADGFGGAHMVSAVLRCLCKDLRGKHGSLAADAGQYDVDHLFSTSNRDGIEGAHLRA